MACFVFFRRERTVSREKKSKLLVHLFCLAKQYKNNEKLRRITEESFNNPILAKLTVHFSDEGGVGKETLSLPSCLTARCQFDRSRLQATRGAPVLFFSTHLRKQSGSTHQTELEPGCKGKRRREKGRRRKTQTDKRQIVGFVVFIICFEKWCPK